GGLPAAGDDRAADALQRRAGGAGAPGARGPVAAPRRCRRGGGRAVADAPLSEPAARRAQRVERARLTTRRLLGLDRSGPPPPDPLVDRVLVVSELAVCWSYELLPRWAIGILVGRELLMVALARVAIQRGVELEINWFGRLGVWWTMAAPFWAMVGVDVLAKLGLYVGVALSLIATLIY